MASVTIRDLRKSFGALEILKGVTLSVEDGEFIVLVGPSGCGKSTLLRMIAGLEGITGGTIEIGGRIVNELEPRDRDIAMVFQSYALYPHMTVRQNMAFNLKLRGEPETAIAEKVGGAAQILDLDTLLARYPRQLSGGQRQRVAMGRAIVRKPQLFLFDEPLSNLDAKLRVQMRIEIRRLHQSLAATSVYVTHDQVEAMTMADRIVVMNKGRIEQVGTPLELYDRPANRFVAEFIGSPAINLLEGTVEEAGGRRGLRVAPGLTIELPPGSAAAAGSRLLAGFRPEHLSPLHDGPIRGDVQIVEHLGPETFIYADVEGRQLCCRTGRETPARAGVPMAFAVDAAHLHLFDPQSGARL
ncbi:MAG TPA: sn-glycerol-3-phosphate ABC transporter ATP-binding protein UgpC [Microvirga sp.]|jgi:multiple sugar transport system ATP-binding protein|nr:sn-glycerol-3-phosphate ABC transporter ATP-binding protein UgpC [Microvirga sp.]